MLLRPRLGRSKRCDEGSVSRAIIPAPQSFRYAPSHPAHPGGRRELGVRGRELCLLSRPVPINWTGKVRSGCPLMDGEPTRARWMSGHAASHRWRFAARRVRAMLDTVHHDLFSGGVVPEARHNSVPKAREIAGPHPSKITDCHSASRALRLPPEPRTPSVTTRCAADRAWPIARGGLTTIHGHHARLYDPP